jgi:hypothetical protein
MRMSPARLGVSDGEGVALSELRHLYVYQWFETDFEVLEQTLQDREAAGLSRLQTLSVSTFDPAATIPSTARLEQLVQSFNIVETPDLDLYSISLDPHLDVNTWSLH